MAMFLGAGDRRMSDGRIVVSLVRVLLTADSLWRARLTAASLMTAKMTAASLVTVQLTGASLSGSIRAAGDEIDITGGAD